MSFEYIRRIPSVEEILSDMPLSAKLKEVKAERDREISACLRGEKEKFLLIMGPCSADDEGAVCTYIEKLKKLSEEVSDKIVIIPRIYTNKPRTTGVGYKGMGHQPNPMEKPNMVEGLKAIRKMHIRVLSETHLTAADEMLYPGNYPYLEDLLSYVAIGARSVENQQHRLTISGIDVGAGMKNPTSGDLEVMFNSILAAQEPHIFTYNGWEVKTSGNLLTHAILRGSVDQYGQNIPNYHFEDLTRAAERYIERELAYPTIIVDTNHANSQKRYKEQPRIAKEILRSRKHSSQLNKLVKGLMIESYLEEGSQPITESVFGKSITDPCLGWKESEQLVREIAEML